MARRRNRRGQSNWRIGFKMFKLALLGGAVGAVGFYGYEVGQRLALEEVTSLRHEIEGLTTAATERSDEIARLETELSATRARADDFEAKYVAVAPTAETQDILAAVRAKLDAGLEPKRLAFVVRSAERPRRCGNEETKRFMVRTPHYDGNATWVRFSDLITVSALGASANGGTEQWFDPDQPLKVEFTVIGGKKVEVEGKLPIQHSMVVKNGEYRFTVAPGARGFVEVTGDRCDYKS